MARPELCHRLILSPAPDGPEPVDNRPMIRPVVCGPGRRIFLQPAPKAAPKAPLRSLKSAPLQGESQYRYRDSNSDLRWRENDAHRSRTYIACPPTESASTEELKQPCRSPLSSGNSCARRRRDTVASFRIGSRNPRGLCPISAHSKPLTRSDESAKPADLQVDQPDSRARHSDCHAEGRGFESLQPLSRKPR